ncbi:MAG TPA: IclR family transcriptional regulator [Euzebya sp.]|nr:IclR family transcriptional regulator [Euzebya sp.]
MAERSGSRTLSRGLSVLRALGTSSDGATVAQIAVQTGLDRAVLYRLLDTLTEDGFVVRDESTRLFHLGVALVELGAKAGRGLEVSRLAAGGMHQLMELTREAVCLAVRDRDDLVVVERVEPPGLFVRIGYSVGFRHPIAVGAHGQALLAYIAPLGEDAHLDDGVRQRIRRRGYAVSTDELEHGASGVAAPILDQHGQAVAALGVVAPTPRLPDPATLGPRIAKTAMEISRRLGYIR